jgi:hypothetical protein
MIVDRISYTPRGTRSRRLAPDRENSKLSNPASSAKDGGANLPPMARSLPILAPTWPRVFPGL